MEKVYFIHQDSNHLERRSDGLNLVIAPKISANDICFYCNEYDSFALSISDFEKNKFVPVPKSMNFHAANLQEICHQGFSGAVDLIASYNVESNNYEYINLFLKGSLGGGEKIAFFSLKSNDNQAGVFCKLPDFFDEKIYFYSPPEGCFWHRPEEFGLKSKAAKYKSNNVSPASLLDIYEAGYLDLIVGVKQFLLAREGLVESDSICF